MDHDFTVLSPEKTILSYRLGGIGSRGQAHFIDLLIVALLFLGLSVLIGYLGVVGVLPEGISGATILFSTFALPVLYFVLQEWLWNGRTLGKKIRSLRVCMEDGTPVTLPAVIARNLLRPADFLPSFYMAGMLAMFTNPQSQRIGDMVAKTIVLNERQTPIMYAVAPHTAGIHPFEAHVGDLRGLCAEEYDALRRLCDRFPESNPETQVRLLQTVWTPIADRLGVVNPVGVHPLYLAEATVMKYGRQHGLL